ncbi:Rne/Rng family ribonuclease [Methylosinus sporium]|uniref:Ribonuclease E n=1 Tax=Methylosinus sporium TaxID=428 RepID=A0A549T7V9_METSR|nr:MULTISPECIES: ribonuclease E/G [Methylosinus]MBU3889012.1 Rne/Rng family ribonuclease [Methylosinus sp. KRF6]TRL37953.1 Rne/Rng family ribonuclease [Methylosinus sporium]
MANKMLIDASHPEETRVVVLRGNRVQEFDFEAADKRPLRGNIYLAKVTRVEPSLQAAFVDYGGNRHGFLAFAEIHPDYYQIPVADRIALLEEESRVHQQEDEEPRQHSGGRRRSRRRHSDGAEKRANADEVISESAPENEEGAEAEAPAVEAAGPVEAETRAQAETPAQDLSVESAEPESAPVAEAVETLAPEAAEAPISVDPQGFGVVEVGHAEEAPVEPAEADHEAKARHQEERDEEHEAEREEAEARRRDDDHDEEEEHEDEEEHVEHIGGDAMEEVPHRPSRSRRQYKIQEVIKRRQVLLVQVVKEERGNKGAALTTYLSLAGRYSVLMPNTARGGGISRKITDGADRKRLKEIVQELEVPEGMGVILRTAGATRTKAEVKRDFEYLLRMWESVRELTLRSSAPTLVYEEGSLIKRAIRDLYGRDVEEVIVSGEESYREAKDFMRMLIPSHAKNVRLYRDPNPIFAAAGAEAQLDALFSNQVTLKSGGYLVINQTEALVAIDVNSGRSTREHNIEDTALRTNLEAADEVARQLRLRDLAGLIVVDFIDMEESRNNRSVERRLKDALKNDRARIQVGRISHFGLLEMSRQRIRAGVLEGSTVPCPHCAGAGTVRSTASIALHVLRVLEDALIKSAAHDIILRTRTVVALYILNQKRGHLQALERRFGVAITVSADDSLTGTSYHALERGEPATGVRELPTQQPLRVDSLADLEEEIEPTETETETEADEVAERRPETPRREERAPFTEEEGEGQARGRRRRRRRGRGGGLSGGEAPAPGAEQPSDEGLAIVAEIDGVPAAPANEVPRPAERGSRGGRGRRAGRWTRSSPLPPEFREQGAFPLDEGAAETAVSAAEAHIPPYEAPEAAPAPAVTEAAQIAEASAPEASAPEAPAPEAPADSATPVEGAAPAAPAPEAPSAAAEAPEPAAPPTPIVHEAAAPPAPPRKPTETVITEADPNRPKKGGWWQRAKASLGGE